jgi:hypothetical protein
MFGLYICIYLIYKIDLINVNNYTMSTESNNRKNYN